MTLPPEERQAYIDEVGKDDVSLHGKLSELVDVASQEITTANTSGQGAGWRGIEEGDNIGKYTILGKLGGGGMGVVYRAEDRRLKRVVAIKFLAPELTRDPEAKTRFIQEAQAASALEHPNICTIYEADETPDGITYIVMPCYEGETLKQKLIQGPLSVDTALRLAQQIGAGLKKAHSKGIVHRDIKPANIMVAKDGDQETIKILDFGLAKVSDVSITRTGSTLGTVAYMSPEQARGESVDYRTDIWSLGVIVYEMLAGQRPFPGGFEHAVTYQLLYEPHKPLALHRPDLPAELGDILDKALDKDVDNRYQTVYDFIEDLSTQSRPKDLAAPAYAPAPKAKRVSLTKRSITPLAGILVSVIALAALYLLFNPKPETRNAKPESTHKQITFSGTAYDPAISPDGSMVAYFAKESEGVGSVLLQDLSGGQPLKLLSQITTRSPLHSFIKWSPDGTMLAVNTEVEGKQGIYLIPRLGGQPRVIVNRTNSLFHDWSPDGDLLAVTYEGAKNLVLIDANTMKREIIALEDTYDFPGGISWSRHSNEIALITQSENYTRYEISLVSPDGLNQRKILEDSLRLFSPRWGDEGRILYYLKHDQQGMELWKIDTQSSKNRSPLLVQDGLKEGAQFTFSEDQSRLVYYSK